MDAPPTEVMPVVVSEPFTESFAEVLEEAKRRYFAGEAADALMLFEVLGRRLTFGEQPGEDLARDALIYLGEIYYTLGRFDDATAAFRRVLEADPNAPINPYHHPDEVRGAFELVREAVKREIAARLANPPVVVRLPPPDSPDWLWAPFGAGQIGQGQVGRGTAYALAQGGFGVVAIASYARLRTRNGRLNDSTQWDSSVQADVDAANAIQFERYAVQWPATFGFYGIWLLSVADAQLHWRAEQARHAAAVSVGPNPDGADLVVSFRF